MICNRIFRKIKKLLGIKPQMLFVDASSCMNVSASASISNSKIELKGQSRLEIGDDVVVDGVYMILEDCELTIASNANLSNVNLFAKNSSKVSIGSSVQVSDYDWMLDQSIVSVGECCHFNRGRNALRPYFNISNGELLISDHNVIRADFWIRFGGCVQVGQYNCINERTELRSDESITIGDYNMISYDCNIWDTNTHCMYEPAIRRKKTKAEYPIIGGEFERPKTKPIVIGCDCWIGKGCTILKGSLLEDASVVGTKAIVSNQVVHSNHMIVPNKSTELKICRTTR